MTSDIPKDHITHHNECRYCYFLYELIKDHTSRKHMLDGVKLKFETGEDMLVAVAAHCVHRALENREKQNTEALK